MLTLPTVTLGTGASTLNVTVDNPMETLMKCGKQYDEPGYMFISYQGLPFTEDF